MGADCNCIKDDREYEFMPGEGAYKFKKTV